MKTFLFFLLTCWAVHASIADQMMEMQTGRDKFVIVVLLEQDVSLDEARAEAMRRAAEISHEAGYKYFVIQSEMKVQATKTTGVDSNPSNLFQKDIIEGNPRTASPRTSSVPALRMSFQSLDEKPLGKRAYNVCDYTSCK